MSLTRSQIAAAYHKEHGPLIEPVQGFDSLAPILHLPYSIGRAHGFTDLGTYVAKALDHGGTDTHRGPPAWAYDLGRKNRFMFKGWDYLVARRHARWLWNNHKALGIEYVILGNKIASREVGDWHFYDDKEHTHSFHIHVSGHWPGR